MHFYILHDYMLHYYLSYDECLFMQHVHIILSMFIFWDSKLRACSALRCFVDGWTLLADCGNDVGYPQVLWYESYLLVRRHSVLYILTSLDWARLCIFDLLYLVYLDSCIAWFCKLICLYRDCYHSCSRFILFLNTPFDGTCLKLDCPGGSGRTTC